MRRLARLIRFALVIAFCWLVIGSFFATRKDAIPSLHGEPNDPDLHAIYVLSTCGIWALLTPAVVVIADRLRVRSLRVRLLLTASLLLIAAIPTVLDAWLPSVVLDRPLERIEFLQTAAAVFHLHVLFAGIIVGITYFMRASADADRQAEREAHIRAELAGAQLRSLRRDLQPHFLFNTLHAVTALIHTDARAAERTIVKLMELLRTSMNASVHVEVLLAEELDFVARYLDLQKTRFGDRLHARIDVEDLELLRVYVPPLLLQPLVENAIVHGIRKRPDGGKVVVRAFRHRNHLRIEVRDSGPGCDPERPFSGGSIGVPNTRARLEVLYHDPRALWYTREDDAFVAGIRIPLRFG
jgi:signal transduction histidine kinase